MSYSFSKKPKEVPWGFHEVLSTESDVLKDCPFLRKTLRQLFSSTDTAREKCIQCRASEAMIVIGPETERLFVRRNKTMCLFLRPQKPT